MGNNVYENCKMLGKPFVDSGPRVSCPFRCECGWKKVARCPPRLTNWGTWMACLFV